MRITLRAVNNELARHGYAAGLAKASGYFYFQFEEAAEWLDRTLENETVSSRSGNEWIQEFHRMKKLNEQIMEQPAPKKPGRNPAPGRWIGRRITTWGSALHDAV